MTRAETDLASAVRRAAVRATRAPSVHNSQPWRFVRRTGMLDVYADWTRQLRVLDPVGRQLFLSCGCAVFNARVAAAAAGVPVDVDRFPAGPHSNLVARIVLVQPDAAAADGAIAHLDDAIDVRQSNRRRFDDEAVPAAVVEKFVEVAHAEGAQLFPIRRAEHRAAVARLSQLADRIEYAEPAYRAELRRWTTDDPHRVDGIPAFAVPHVDGTADDDVPIRDFDTRGSGKLPAQTRSSADQCLLLLGTNADNPGGWLRAGEALERVWLEIAHRGYTASLFTQVIEVPSTREQLRLELGTSMKPHVLLRVGRAPRTATTRRRRLVDVVFETE